MIRRCRIWLFGAAVIVLGALTSGFMAAQATANGAADSFLSALLTAPPQQIAPASSLSGPSGQAGIGSLAIAARSAAPAIAAEPREAGHRPDIQSAIQPRR